MKPLISIIVPVFNSEQYIEECLNRLLKQTYKNIEIIIVDDGSTDSSGYICDMISLKDSRVKLFHKSNSGVSEARNLGLKESSGDYIGFVDSDDLIDVSMYEKLVDISIKYGADISVCGMRKTSSKNSCSKGNHKEYRILKSKEEALLSLFTTGSYFESSCCNKLFRRSVLDGVYFKRITNGEDVDFLFNCVMKCNHPIVCTNEVLYWYIYRFNSASQSSVFNNNNLSILYVADEILDAVDTFHSYEVKRSAYAYHLRWYVSVLQHMFNADNKEELIDEIRHIKNKVISNSSKYILNKYASVGDRILYVAFIMGFFDPVQKMYRKYKGINIKK